MSKFDKFSQGVAWLSGVNDRFGKFKKRMSSRFSNSEAVVFFFHRTSDSSEFKKNNKKRADEAVPLLIEGSGGIKNILSISNSYTAVTVKFRNKYQVKEDILKKAGGLSLFLDDRKWVDIFDYIEAREITSAIKKKIQSSKKTLKAIDWE